MSVSKATKRVLLLGLGFMLAGLFVPEAKATPIYLDFGCSGVSGCAGNVVVSGGSYSSTGITLKEGSGFYAPGSLFTLTFNSLADTISLIGQGALSGQIFTGTFTNFTASTFGGTTDLNFGSIWSTIPTDIQAFFGTTSGADSGFAIYLTGVGGGPATSVDLTITPSPTKTPEPDSPLLCSAGLLGLGFLLAMRKAGSVA